jgi:hypothetical protein
MAKVEGSAAFICTGCGGRIETAKNFLRYLGARGYAGRQLEEAIEYVKEPRVLPGSTLSHVQDRNDFAGGDPCGRVHLAEYFLDIRAACDDGLVAGNHGGAPVATGRDERCGQVAAADVLGECSRDCLAQVGGQHDGRIRVV